MPKKNVIYNNLESIVLSNYIDISVFFWVSGIRYLMPNVTIEQALTLYVKYNKIADYDVANLRNRYMSMQTKLYKQNKRNNETAN